MSAAKASAQESINSKPVVIFSKSYCPYCTQTKKVLGQFLGVNLNERLDASAGGIKTGDNYKLIELDLAPEGSAIQNALKDITQQGTVPNIFIGQKHIGGNSDLQELSSLDKLEGVLKDAGAL